MKPVKLILLFFYIIISLLTQQTNANTTSKYYEPVQEKLTGVIKNLTFPGPPNYENIKNGDRSETCPYLILDYPIDVSTKQSIPIDSKLPYEDEKNVQLIQLVVSKKTHWVVMKDGVRVTVKGELYAAHTGHHHTRVLMYLDDAQLDNSKPNFAFKSLILCKHNNGFCEVELIKKGTQR